MGKVSFNMTMSLDGFVAGPNGEVDQLFKWYFSGEEEVPFPGSNYVFKVSPASAERLRHAGEIVGAIVTGRRNFDGTHGWAGTPPLGVHHFVVTHRPPEDWVQPDWPFTFVTDGVASAIAQAKQHAGDKDVVISSASILQQGLRAGLVDEVTIDLAHVLLGRGLRLFENLGPEPIELENTGVVEGTGVTHLTFRVVKEN
jgi:dihydrofolate reductase